MTIQTVLESDVNAIVAKAAAFVAGVENAAEIVVEDIDTFFQWLAGEAPTFNYDAGLLALEIGGVLAGVAGRGAGA